jgi:hypothetical protein
MEQSLVEQIIRTIDAAAEQYHRLVLLIASSPADGTAVLQELAQQSGFRAVNLNLELSQRLLELSERQRALRMTRLLDEIVGTDCEPVLVLDHIELLFDPALQQDPLRCLQHLSRNRTVVATWNGQLEEGYLTYAMPDHPEYRRYPARDLLCVVQQERE